MGFGHCAFLCPSLPGSGTRASFAASLHLHHSVHKMGVKAAVRRPRRDGSPPCSPRWLTCSLCAVGVRLGVMTIMMMMLGALLPHSMKSGSLEQPGVSSPAQRIASLELTEARLPVLSVSFAQPFLNFTRVLTSAATMVHLFSAQRPGSAAGLEVVLLSSLVRNKDHETYLLPLLPGWRDRPRAPCCPGGRKARTSSLGDSCPQPPFPGQVE